MKVLIVTNVYLKKGLNQKQASFVRDQMTAIKKYHPDVEFYEYVIHGQDDKLSYIKALFEVPRLIKQGHFDIIHIHYGISGMFLLFMKKPSIPIVMTLHGGDIQEEYNKRMHIRITKKILPKVDYVCSLNERMKSIVLKYCKNTSIIPISVDMKYFTPAETPRPVSKDVRIIFPGFITNPVKNHPLYVKVKQILENKYQYHVQEIDFYNISHEEVKNHYKTSDLELLTSFSEGSPGVVKEAMACNLPIVATNVGDVAVLLDGVKNCAVAKSFDAEELAALCDKALSHVIPGKTGRERLVELGYDDKSISDKTYELYKSLIKK